ncbi:MAG: hypothetical protein KDH18_25735, partial [Rhodoferax sp.]|nr:hypothetical protein [Rhodoferax sp.]MCB2043934.1 hypothetical protein [Rhodoferax sp.]
MTTHPMIRRLRRSTEPLIGIAAALMLWEVTGRQVANATLVPMPAMVWKAFLAMMADDLPRDILASLLHLAIGYGLGTLCGLALAL